MKRTSLLLIILMLVAAISATAWAQQEPKNKLSGKALEFYQSALAGDAEAQYKLGDCYYYGDSVKQDYQQAVYWYQKSAEKDYAKAQYSLGYCYEYEKGVAQDYQQAFYWYQKAASQGYAEAQKNLGLCYEKAKGVQQDFYQAVEWYRKAAEQGDAGGQYYLAYCYENGLGVPQDYEQAVEWYRKAAEQEDVNAQCILGYHYYMGEILDKDFKQAVKWFQKAAEKDYDLAQYALGLCFFNGQGVEVNYQEAFSWFSKAAEQGLADAQYYVAVFYEYGNIVPLDYKKAEEWYRKAAVQGNSSAQRTLGDFYYYAKGVPQDYQQAVEWYLKAAEQGDASAQNSLGHCYINGNGVTQDYQKAVEWYRKAAEQGNAIAQCSLGICYESSIGVKQDYQQALYWYNESANQGNSIAQNNLGKCFLNGNGVAQNYQKAVDWFSLAAEQGYADAQFNLGNCYEKGYSVSQDYKQAFFWYKKSAEQGLAKAQNTLGMYYYYGYGMPRDYQQAKYWVVQAAEQGDAAAQCSLGYFYENGIGVLQDIQQAIKWYIKSAEQGSSQAQSNLGDCYYNGIGVPQNFQMAIYWFLKAAQQGNTGAQNYLGLCYFIDRCQHQDYKLAVEWASKAAENGYSIAQVILGLCYYNGYGVKKDYKRAVKMFHKAVEQDDAAAKYNLGFCYFYGNGVEKDYSHALNNWQEAFHYYYNNQDGANDLERNYYDEIVNTLSSIDETTLNSLSPDKQMTVLVGKSLRSLKINLNEAVGYFQRVMSLYQHNRDADYAEQEMGILVNKLAGIDDYTIAALPPDKKRFVLYMKGYKKTLDQDYAQAIKDFEEAVDISITNNYFDTFLCDYIVSYLHRCYYYTSNEGSSFVILNSLLQRDDGKSIPDEVRLKLCFYIGEHIYLKGNFEDAIPLLEKTAKLYSKGKIFDSSFERTIDCLYSSLYNTHSEMNSFKQIITSFDLGLASPHTRAKLNYYNAVLEEDTNTTEANVLLENARKEYIENALSRDQNYLLTCNNLCYTYKLLGKRKELETCLKDVISDCSDLMDARPDVACDLYIHLQNLYIEEDNTQMADMVFYTKLLQYILKKTHDEMPGRFMKNYLERYNNIILSYKGGLGKNDPGILAKIGDLMYDIGSFDYSKKCYDDCIEVAKRNNSSIDLRNAYLRRLDLAFISHNDSLFSECYQDAQLYANQINNNVFNVAVLENFIGEAYFIHGYSNMDMLKKAQKHFDRANAYIVSAKIPKDSQLAQAVKLNIARNQLYMGNDNVFSVLDNIKSNKTLDAKEKDSFMLLGYMWWGKYHLEKNHLSEAINILTHAAEYLRKDNLFEKRDILMQLYQAKRLLNGNNKAPELEELIEEIKEVDKVITGGQSDEVKNLLKN